MAFSRTLVCGTDVAHFLVFHPADLAHTAEWPLGWYATPAVYRHESAAGRLLAWCTGSDGGWKVRLTTGTVTAREAPFVRQTWTFPLTVRHGRVVLDNSDGLPGESRMVDPLEDEARWIDLDNGHYDVELHAIEWSAEPGGSVESVESLPNFTLCFRRREGAAPAVAQRPPTLDGSSERAATDELALEAGAHEAQPEKHDFSLPIPAFAAAGVRAPPAAFEIDDVDLADAVEGGSTGWVLFGQTFVAAPRLEAGALAVLCTVGSKSIRSFDDASGKRVRFGLGSSALVRIDAVMGPWAKPDAAAKRRLFGLIPSARQHVEGVFGVMVSPVEAHAPSSHAAALEPLRSRVLAALRPDAPLARRIGGAAGWHALTLQDEQDPSRFCAFCFEHLPLASGESLRIAALALSQRMAALDHALARL